MFFSRLLVSFGICILLMVSHVLAEGKGGHDFYKAAEEYKKKASHYAAQGNSKQADAYQRLSEIKYNAGKLADKGRYDEIDWAEYYRITESLYPSKGKHKGK